MKILSAGQTNTERAVGAVARELGIPYAGRCWNSGEGGNTSAIYRRSVGRNARVADGTLVLTRWMPPRLRSPVMQAILKAGKACLCAGVDCEDNVDATRRWIRRRRIRTLQITGHAPQRQSMKFLHGVLAAMSKQKPTILIVDDQESCAEVLQDTLAGLHCEFVWVSRKDEAIARLSEIRPALVTTDLTPDVVDAFDLIRAVQRYDKGVPVIVVSGTLTPAKARSARRLGAVHCFQKPFDVVLVRDAVAKILSEPKNWLPKN
jgi:CheY-like chemotaxis protein